MRSRTTVLAALILLAALPGVAEPGVKVTGSEADKTTFKTMLSTLSGAAVDIDAEGNLTVGAGGNSFAVFLRAMVAEATVITLAVGRNQDFVIFGRFRRQPPPPGQPQDPNAPSTGTHDIDLDDIEKLGTDPSAGVPTRGGVLTHEIWECMYSKKNGKSFRDSHENSITDCENQHYKDAAEPGKATVRKCAVAVIRDKGNDNFVAYDPAKRGSDGADGFICTPIHKNGNKAEVTGAPTFVAGSTPPPKPGVLALSPQQWIAEFDTTYVGSCSASGGGGTPVPAIGGRLVLAMLGLLVVLIGILGLRRLKVA